MNKRILLRIVRSTLLILLILSFAVPVVFFYKLAIDMHSPVESPEQYLGCRVTPFSVKTQDEVEISGWFLPGKPGQAAVVLLHGIGASRLQMLEQAKFLNHHKYPVVLFDFRNHGISGGRRTTYGAREQLDVAAVVEKTRELAPSAKVVLWGLSMGASTALLAAKGVEADGVIAESPFDSLDGTFTHHAWLYFRLPRLPVVPWTLALIGWDADFDPDLVSPIEAVKASGAIPMLFVTSSEDERMTPALVRHIAKAHPGPTRLFPGKGEHALIFHATGSPYKQEVLQFLQQVDSQK